MGQARNWPVAPAFLSMLPCLVTVACMIGPALLSPRMQRRLAAPAALGLPYFRERR